MSIKINDVLTREIDDLVAIAERLSRDAARSEYELGPERVTELLSVTSRGGQLINRLYGGGSHYENSFQQVLSTDMFSSMHSNYHRHVSELVGILKGVQHEIKSGLLTDLRRLLQAEIFADFLEMSEHLLNEGYKDASAVLLGGVLEDSLRKLADSKCVAVVSPTGKPLTIDPLNVALAKAGVYNALVQKQITTWANLRNDAAHGQFTKYDAEQVRQMLLFVQKFCSDFLS
jgi:uncharacterized protein (DUF2164 family)